MLSKRHVTPKINFCKSKEIKQNSQQNRLTLSLRNATVVELTIRCQTRRLQSKFKGTIDSCLFLTVIRDANLCSLFKMLRGHNNIVCGILCTRMDFTKNICNVIRFRGNKKYRKLVHGDDIQDALSPSTAIFFIYF